MKNYQMYIRALRQCEAEHDKDITPFGHIIVSELCRDTALLLQSLDQEQKLREKLRRNNT